MPSISRNLGVWKCPHTSTSSRPVAPRKCHRSTRTGSTSERVNRWNRHICMKGRETGCVFVSAHLGCTFDAFLLFLFLVEFEQLPASLARRVYMNQGAGIGKLRKFYGGAQSRGTCPQRFRKSAGGHLRYVYLFFSSHPSPPSLSHTHLYVYVWRWTLQAGTS